MDRENRIDVTGGEAAHDMGEIRPSIIRINELYIYIILMRVTDGQRYRRLKITHTHTHMHIYIHKRQSHIRHNIGISAI